MPIIFVPIKKESICFRSRNNENGKDYNNFSDLSYPYKNSYLTCWLILVNYLNTDFDDEDVLEIKEYLKSKGDFDNVKVLNPSDLKIIFEL